MPLLVLHWLQRRDAYCQEHQGYLDTLRELYIESKILNIPTLRMVDILRPSKIVYYPINNATAIPIIPVKERALQKRRIWPYFL